MPKMDLLKVQDEQADPENKFGYPTTCHGYVPIGNENYKIHLIIGTAAPSTNYNNAPVGSILLDVTNAVFYIKDATGANWFTITGTT